MCPWGSMLEVVGRNADLDPCERNAAKGGVNGLGSARTMLLSHKGNHIAAPPCSLSIDEIWV